MKRFLLFVFDHYYPSGGFNDLDSSHDTVQEAVEMGNEKVPDGAMASFHVFDLEVRKIVNIDGKQTVGDTIGEAWKLLNP